MADKEDKDPKDDAPVVRAYGYEYDGGEIVDLSKQTKLRISQYMSDLTHGKNPVGSAQRFNHGNRHPIPGPTENPETSYDVDPVTGLPLSVLPSTNPFAYTSAAGATTEAIGLISQFSSKSENYLKMVGKKIWSGGDQESALDGNKLLHGNFDAIGLSLDVVNAAVSGDPKTVEEKAFVIGYTSQVLAHNRFSPLQFADSFGSPNVAPPPLNIGKKDAAKLKIGGFTVSGAKEMTSAQLGLVGQNLMIRAAGGTPPAGNALNRIVETDLSVVNNSQKISQLSMRVADILSEIPDNLSVEKSAIIDPTNKGGAANADTIPSSYGSIYTPHNQFISSNPTTNAQLRALVGSIYKTICVQNNNSDVLRINPYNNIPTDPSIGAGPKYVGRNVVTDGNQPAPDYYFNKGFEFYFSIDANAIPNDISKIPKTEAEAAAAAKGQKFTSSLDTRDYRQQGVTLRKLLLLAKKAGYVNAGYNDIQPQKNVSAEQQQRILSIISSFVSIGHVIEANENIENKPADFPKLQDRIVKSGEQYDPQFQSNKKIMTLKGSVANSPALLLPVVSPVAGNQMYDEGDEALRKKYLNVKVQDTISADEIKTLKSQLGKDYVPFYFQDLRTNEIVSFHAYLKSLSDDYTAAYDSHDYIGRGEPIHVYKGSTSRKIGISFSVFATNPNDFRAMWLKVNKLTTLVYPQYDAGRPVSFSKKNFTMPFSQVLSHSPMIRLRIGDLIRSNYSEQAIAGMFGRSESDPDFGEFVDPAQNSIVRAFETSGAGDGLAGFVGSLKFTWLQERYPWETNGMDGQNTDLWIAPKAFDVSLDFSPVHDIAPGLDAMGRNRAPVYRTWRDSDNKTGKMTQTGQQPPDPPSAEDRQAVNNYVDQMREGSTKI